MYRTFLKSKIHRATVTDADINYVGSISLCPTLMEVAGLLENEEVTILNCNNGERFTTYVIKGTPQEVTLNGAAARLVLPGDKVLILSYCQLDESEIAGHEPVVVHVNEKNEMIPFSDATSL